jgi:DNA-binding LytR/AlgR family response regulator
MIKAIAIDDEPMALDVIKKFSKTIPNFSLEETFVQTKKAHAYLEENDIDVLILDINMPEQTGFEFMESLTKEYIIIFSTAYNEFAVDAYESNAIDYLLKPYTKERFEKSINRIFNLLNMQKFVVNKDVFLSINIDHRKMNINTNEIKYIESFGDYLDIHLLSNVTHRTRNTMKSILEQLPDNFVRIHRSYIVPIDKAITVSRNTIHLFDIELPIGIRYKDLFNNFTKE